VVPASGVVVVDDDRLLPPHPRTPAVAAASAAAQVRARRTWIPTPTARIGRGRICVLSHCMSASTVGNVVVISHHSMKPARNEAMLVMKPCSGARVSSVLLAGKVM
jgi:hypothetical protein